MTTGSSCESLPACACGDRRYWGIANGDPYIVDLSTGRATPLTSPNGIVVGALFDPANNLVVRVKTGNAYAIELLSPVGQVLKRRIEARQEGTVTNDLGEVYETVSLVGYRP
jgi:hypothetical protein